MNSTKKLYRYANKKNRFSDDLRGGTWYGDFDMIERYKNANRSIKLGGVNLYEIDYTLSNPLVIENSQTNNDIFLDIYFNKDICNTFRSIFSEDDLDIVMDVKSIKDDDELLEFLYNNLDAETYNLLKIQSFYNQKTMWLDNFIAYKLLQNGYDGLLRICDGKILEAFIPKDTIK